MLRQQGQIVKKELLELKKPKAKAKAKAPAEGKGEVKSKLPAAYRLPVRCPDKREFYTAIPGIRFLEVASLSNALAEPASSLSITTASLGHGRQRTLSTCAAG